VLALLGLGLAGAVGGRMLWAEYHYRAAREALGRRDPAEAKRHLAHCRGVWPRADASLLLEARAARLSSDYAEAVQLLQECEKRKIADADGLALEEQLLDAQQGILAGDGVAYLRARAAKDPAEAPAIFEALTHGYLYTYRLGEALDCVQLWLERRPTDARGLYLRGLIWEGLAFPDKAADDYRQALAADPEQVPARQRLAEYLLSNKRSREAAEYLDWLMRRDPDDAGVLLGLARCNRQQFKFAEARQFLDTLLESHPTMVAALRERGGLARDEGDAADAERWFRRALDHDPYDRQTWFELGQCLLQLNQKDEARRCLDKADAIDRDLTRFRELQAKIAAAPGDADLRYEAAMICLRNGQREEARRWLRGVQRINPNHAKAREALSSIESSDIR
jgi:tetratricopeptide (TPR) repeat protein